MFQGGAALEGSQVNDSFFLIGEHIEKDGAVRAVFFCIFILERSAGVRTRGVFFNFAILIAGLTAAV